MSLKRNRKMRFINGRVAEWPNAPVLKTDVPQGTVGSNPTSSVYFFLRGDAYASSPPARL